MRTIILVMLASLALLAACAPAGNVIVEPTPPPPPPAPSFDPSLIVDGQLTLTHSFAELDTAGIELPESELLLTPDEAAAACGLTKSYAGIRMDSLFQTFQDTLAPNGRIIYEITTFESEDDARKSFLRRKRDLVQVTEFSPSYAKGHQLDAQGEPFFRYYVFHEGVYSVRVSVLPRATCVSSKVELLNELLRQRLAQKA